MDVASESIQRPRTRLWLRTNPDQGRSKDLPTDEINVSSLPSDVIGRVLQHGGAQGQLALLHHIVLENRSSAGPWTAPHSSLRSDTDLLRGHPAVSTALGDLITDVSITTFAQASAPANAVDLFSRRRQAFVARCLWASLANPGERAYERAAILTLIAPTQQRHDEALGLLTTAQRSADFQSMTTEQRCDFLERLRGASFPPTHIDGYARAGELMLQLISGLSPIERVPELRKVVRYAAQHNLDDLLCNISTRVADLLHDPGSVHQVPALCKELFLVPAIDENEYLKGNVSRGLLTERPHIDQLAQVLRKEELSPHVALMFAGAEGIRSFWKSPDYLPDDMFDLLYSSKITLAAKADFCDLVSRHETDSQRRDLLEWLRDEVRDAQIPPDGADRQAYARVLSLALDCSRDEWRYENTHGDESDDDFDLPDNPSELHFDYDTCAKMTRNAYALVAEAKLPPEVEVSLLAHLRSDLGWIDEDRMHGIPPALTGAVCRAVPTIAERLVAGEFYRAQDDLELLNIAYHELANSHLTISTDERSRLDNAMAHFFRNLAHPHIYAEMVEIVHGDGELASIMRHYIDAAIERTPPLPSRLRELLPDLGQIEI